MPGAFTFSGALDMSHSVGLTHDEHLSPHSPCTSLDNLADVVQQAQESSTAASVTGDEVEQIREQDLVLQSCAAKTRGCWWYVRHPWARLFTALAIFGLDFLYYAEDPIVHSQLRSELPIGGSAVQMLLGRWPSNGGLQTLKVLWGWVFAAAGCVVGKLLVHDKLLRDKMRVNMFEEDQGSWTLMLITAVIFLWLSAFPYNVMVGSSEPQVTDDLGITFLQFGIIAQMCTWLGDLWTLIMVLDSMLQDSTAYPEWATFCKPCWNRCRIFGCWFLAIVPTVICFTLIILNDADDGRESEWDELAQGSVEWQRCLLVSTIILCDISIIVQDWEFPTFDSSLSASIKVPGLDVTEIDFELLGWCKKSRLYEWLHQTNFFEVKITGKWIAYGPLMVILCLDLNCARNQILYEPVNFGQYAEASTDKIWTITSSADISALYDGVTALNSASVTWEARKGNTDINYAASLSDVQMASKYQATSMAFTGMALAPGLIAVPVALFLFWKYNENCELRQVKSRARWKRAKKLLKVGMMQATVVPDEKAVAIEDVSQESFETEDAIPQNVNTVHEAQMPKVDNDT